jgi:hypothetical protein
MMRNFLSCTAAATAIAACLATTTPASALTIDLFFNSDHCTDGCGDGTPAGQPNGGFAVAHLTQNVVGTVDIAIELLNNNVFAGGGFPVAYAFNLVGIDTVTYTNIVNSTYFAIPNAVNTNQQVAGAYSMDGFGDFEYGLEYLGKGTSCFGTNTCQSTLSFTLSAAGLTLASFLELSTGNGSDPANMALDIYSGFGPGLGNTGPVDYTTVSVPGPIVGAGIPGLIAACGGMFGLNFWRRRRNGNTLPA